jgi:acetolactate synthase small subunit
MNLQIEPDQADLLRDILDSVYRDVRYEVADTNNSEYKVRLREREHKIRALLDLVGGPLADE